MRADAVARGMYDEDPKQNLVAVPQNMVLFAAATMPLEAGTAWSALVYL